MVNTIGAGQALADLWLSTLKLLGRPAVQQQLLIGLVAILAAWLLAHWLNGRLRRQEIAYRHSLRAEIIEEAHACLDQVIVTSEADAGQNEEVASSVSSQTAQMTEMDEAERDPSDYYETLLQDQDALAKAANQRRNLLSRSRYMLRQILFPLLATLFLYLGYLYSVSQERYSGLIMSLIQLMILYLVYRFFFGVAYALGNPQKVAHYQHRFFGPLLAVGIVLLVVNTIGDLSTLANAVLFPAIPDSITLGALFVVTFGLYFWLTGISLTKDLIHSFARRFTNSDSGALNAGLTLVQYGFIALGLLAVFQVLQLNPATIAAITGGLSIGIGFALQDVLRNFLGGIIVLFEGTVRPGDWVQIDDTEGEISTISVRSTVVRTFDGVDYIVPNQDWLDSTVITFTRYSRRVRAQLSISVSSATDPALVQQVLTTAAQEHPEVLADAALLAPLVAVGQSAGDYVLLFWVADAKSKGRVVAEVRLLIRQALIDQGIEIHSGESYSRADVAPIVQARGDAVNA